MQLDALAYLRCHVRPVYRVTIEALRPPTTS